METPPIKILQMRPFLIAFLLFIAIATVESNSEGDALHAWRTELNDPNNVLQSWDPTLVNPCTWFHVTCNSANSVTRVDVGEAGLAGPLVPELGSLVNLQYLQVEHNNINGEIPRALGNLTKLVSLGLDHNQLTGSIPNTLGNLRFLRFMRLNSNKLTGKIPLQVIQLVHWGNLQIMNVSDNRLAGTVHHTNKTELEMISSQTSSGILASATYVGGFSVEPTRGFQMGRRHIDVWPEIRTTRIV